MELSEHQLSRIQDDLRGLLDGDVRFDRITRQIFATDASIYEIRPLGVVRPRGVNDLVKLLGFATKKGIPLHCRGAGTTAFGGSLGPGIVVDFSQHFRRIFDINDRTVRVQPGLVLSELQARLERHGLRFGPDPFDSEMMTIGGAIGLDATGSHYMCDGRTADKIDSLGLVLADGHMISAGREPLVGGVSEDPHPRKRDLINRLVSVFSEHRSTIEKLPGGMVSGGYRVQDVLNNNRFDLARLIAGSEGTLAVVAEARLKLDSLPGHRTAAILLFDSLEKASQAALMVRDFELSLCDMMDRRYLSLAREVDPRLDSIIPFATEAILAIEAEAASETESQARLDRAIDAIRHKSRLAFGVRATSKADQVELFSKLSSVRLRLPLGRLEGVSRPVSIVEDMSVAPDELPRFLVACQNRLKQQELNGALFCHPLCGQIHLQPFLDLANPKHVEKMRLLANSVYEDLFACGGVLGGRCGCGLSRSAFLRDQNPELYLFFQSIKQVFDPEGILNPGKIIGCEEHGSIVKNVRKVIPVKRVHPDASIDSGEQNISPTDDQSPAPLRDILELQLNWDSDRIRDIVGQCIGCGQCRSFSPRRRNCPQFQNQPSEEASPRAKANILRAVLMGQIDLKMLLTDEFRQLADLCFHCHICRNECPAGCDIAHLMTEAKGAHVTAKGLSLSAATMTQIDRISFLASIFPRAANRILNQPRLRWLVEKILGVAQWRKLPGFQRQSFILWAMRHRLTRPVVNRPDFDHFSELELPKVAYFADTFVNRCHPELGIAFLRLLKHNGISVFVPPRQRQAGTAAIAGGALEIARKMGRRNIPILADAVRRGYRIVTTEPAAALTLIREYRYLFGNDADLDLVAENTIDSTALLWELHQRGLLKVDFRPIKARVGYHMPCRLKGIEKGRPALELLRLIPGLTVEELEAGCCGMAGTFGIQHANYRKSLRIGRHLIGAMRDPSIELGATECSACKMQMEQITTKSTHHPVEYLAAAYGLIPPNKLLKHQSGDLRIN